MALKDLIVKGPMPSEARAFASRRARPKKPPATKTYRTRAHSRKPQHIDDRTWFYDDRGGLLIVHEIWERESYVRTDQFVIPWRMVVGAVKRHELRPAPLSNEECK